MPSSPLTSMLHVEIVHPDPDAAAEHLRTMFGGVPVEVRTAELIEGMTPGSRIVHVQAGGVVFQIIKPDPATMPRWSEQLEALGPSIFALSFRVENYQEARDAAVAQGAPAVEEFHADLTAVGLGDEPFHAGVVDTREHIGVRLELIDASSGWEAGRAP